MCNPFYENFHLLYYGTLELFDGNNDVGEIIPLYAIESFEYWYSRKARKKPSKKSFDKRGKYIFIKFCLKTGNKKTFCMRKKAGRRLIDSLKTFWQLERDKRLEKNG